jgi:endonuclease/exonuclease/phosphatase family metal-dependent hydrolase
VTPWASKKELGGKHVHKGDVMAIIRVMTFNIHGNDPEWDHLHADPTLGVLQRYPPDLLGLQEVAVPNIEFYRQHLIDYDYELGQKYGEEEGCGYISILWKKARFELLASGNFWFSRTPDIPSNDWGVEYPLGAIWVRLQDKLTGIQLLHLNTQFEDGSWGEQSRQESSQLIVVRIAHLAPNLPVILTGDFNCNPWSSAYNHFQANGFTDTYRAAGNADSVDSSTYHGYAGQQYFALEWGAELFWRVDWILTRDGTQRLQTSSSTIVRDAAPPIYPSDHYPVVSELVVL